MNLERIWEITRSTRNSIKRYVEDYELGRNQADFTPYYGLNLNPRDLARLHGVWHVKMTASDEPT